ncbi:hypothetical protein KY363_06200 [Candidatus Woesearchaeota archaeon]|nr:hypothetical protein [Candidatus Woesearchaeota archaeon]
MAKNKDGMKRAGPRKGRYNFLIDASVYDEFSRLCEELGLVRSKNIENYMKEFIRKHKGEDKD